MPRARPRNLVERVTVLEHGNFLSFRAEICCLTLHSLLSLTYFYVYCSDSYKFCLFLFSSLYFDQSSLPRRLGLLMQTGQLQPPRPSAYFHTSSPAATTATTILKRNAKFPFRLLFLFLKTILRIHNLHKIRSITISAHTLRS